MSKLSVRWINKQHWISQINMKSNQIILFISPKIHNHIASVGYTNCTANNVLCRLTLGNLPYWEKHLNRAKNKSGNLRKSHRGGILLPGWTEMSHVQNRTTKSQLTDCIDRISDRNYNICKVCGSRRRLGRPWHGQVVPEPHNLLSTSWKRAGHAR